MCVWGGDEGELRNDQSCIYWDYFESRLTSRGQVPIKSLAANPKIIIYFMQIYMIL